MSWYNYLFDTIAVLAIICLFLFGMPDSAKKNNVAQLLLQIILVAIWIGVFYWNTYAA